MINYIKGERNGANAHEVELAALCDIFLSNALDGYNSLNVNHVKAVGRVRKSLSVKVFSAARPKIVWVATVVVLCIALALCFVVPRIERSSARRPRIERTAHVATADETRQQGAAGSANEVSVPVGDPEHASTPVVPQATETLTTRQQTTVRHEQNDREQVATAHNVAPIPTSGGDETVPETSAVMQSATQATTTQSATQASAVSPQTDAIKVSAPVGGRRMFDNHVSSSMVKPAGATGNVVLSFMVNGIGRPDYILIERGLTPELNSEAIRLLSSGPDWTQGDSRATVTIEFD